MSQLTPTTGPVFAGKASGSIPNLFWRRITSEQLRAQPQYQGLPLVEHLSLETTADFRYFALCLLVAPNTIFATQYNCSCLSL